jgi:hypothetical protein
MDIPQHARSSTRTASFEHRQHGQRQDNVRSCTSMIEQWERTSGSPPVNGKRLVGAG